MRTGGRLGGQVIGKGSIGYVRRRCFALLGSGTGCIIFCCATQSGGYLVFFVLPCLPFFPTSLWKDKEFLPYLKDKGKNNRKLPLFIAAEFLWNGTLLDPFSVLPPRMRFLRFLFVVWWNISLSFFGWVSWRARGHVPLVCVGMGN